MQMQILKLVVIYLGFHSDCQDTPEMAAWLEEETGPKRTKGLPSIQV